MIVEEDLVEESEEIKGKFFLWKMVVNFMSDMEGIGFLGFFYVIVYIGLVVIVVLFLVFFIVFYIGVILIDCFYEKNYVGERVCCRFNYREFGEVCWFCFGGVIVVVV